MEKAEIKDAKIGKIEFQSGLEEDTKKTRLETQSDLEKEESHPYTEDKKTQSASEEITSEDQQKKKKIDLTGYARRLAKQICGLIMLLATGFLVYVMICTARGQVVDICGRSVLQIITGSMEPTILTGDYIVINKHSAKRLEVGDIITFYTEDQEIAGSIVTHRIVAIAENGNYITRGDANPIDDQYEVPASRIIGKYERKARFLRWIGSFADRRKQILIIAVIPLLLIAVHELLSVGRLWRQVGEERKKDQRAEAEEKLRREAIEEYLSAKSAQEAEKQTEGNPETEKQMEENPEVDNPEKEAVEDEQ